MSRHAAPRFRLRFPASRLEHWAARFDDADDPEIERAIPARARERGFLDRSDFLRLCRWKTPRSAPAAARNAEPFVRAVTAVALTTPDERLRIEVLTLLSGVSWPTASVILHFCHADPYPVLDVRALWSLGIAKPPAYGFEFWNAYVGACRALASRTGRSMRTVDKALWQYAKENE